MAKAKKKVNTSPAKAPRRKAGKKHNDPAKTAKRSNPPAPEPKCTPELIEKAREWIEKWCPTGRTLAKILGVSSRTIDAWRKIGGPYFHADFANAWRDGRLKYYQTRGAEHALAHSAVGFTREIEIPVKDDDGWKTLKLKKYFPPNPQSLKLLMTNTMPEKYKEKHEHKLTTDEKTPIHITFNYDPPTSPPATQEESGDAGNSGNSHNGSAGTNSSQKPGGLEVQPAADAGV